MAAVYEATQRSAWATLPLRVGSELLGSFVACWEQERQFADEDVALLEGFAAQVSQAVLRIRATQAQRAQALSAQRLSETLQLSLLTDPPHVTGLQIAVRYQPAAQEAQIGGDWYDAFVTAAGSTLVVIGDIGGHDRTAAAAWARCATCCAAWRTTATTARRCCSAGSTPPCRASGSTRSRPRCWRASSRRRRLPAALGQRRAPAAGAADGRRPPARARRRERPAARARRRRRARRAHDRPADRQLAGALHRRPHRAPRREPRRRHRRVTQAVSRLGDADAEATADAVVTAAGSSNEDDIAVLVLRVGPDA
jgi:hypothetical protein